MKKLLLSTALASASFASADQCKSLEPQQNIDQKIISDQEIDKQAQEILDSDSFSQGFNDVFFDVAGGSITLVGSVNTIANKNKIEEFIRRIAGVKRIHNQISVLETSSESYSDSQLQISERKYPQDFAATIQDRHLNAKIRDALSSVWVAKSDETLMISTVKRVVLITGVIEKIEDKQKVGDQIKTVDGVSSVNNQLTVKSR